MLDLIEEFRVPLVDSVIFPLFIEKKLSGKEHFERMGPESYLLSAEGKSLIVAAILERMNGKAIWRKKQYEVKAIAEQYIRALARYFLGKEKTFSPLNLTSLFARHE